MTRDELLEGLVAIEAKLEEIRSYAKELDQYAHSDGGDRLNRRALSIYAHRLARKSAVLREELTWVRQGLRRAEEVDQ